MRIRIATLESGMHWPKVWFLFALALAAPRWAVAEPLPLVFVQAGIAPQNDIGQSGFSKAGAALDRSMSSMSTKVKSFFKSNETTTTEESPSPWLTSKKARDPDPDLYTSFGELQAQQGNLAGAETQFKKALAKDKNYLPALLALARVHEARGETQQAEELYRRAIEAHPRDAAAHNDWGMFLAKTGRGSEALKEFGRAAQLDPKNKLYRNNIARPLVGMGQNGEAFAHLSAVYDPSVAYYNMGYLLYEKGDRPGALLHFQRALAANPNFVEARQWCGNLESQFEPRSPGVPYNHPAHPNTPPPMYTQRPAASVPQQPQAQQPVPQPSAQQFVTAPPQSVANPTPTPVASAPPPTAPPAPAMPAAPAPPQNPAPAISEHPSVAASVPSTTQPVERINPEPTPPTHRVVPDHESPSLVPQAVVAVSPPVSEANRITQRPASRPEPLPPPSEPIEPVHVASSRRPAPAPIPRVSEELSAEASPAPSAYESVPEVASTEMPTSEPARPKSRVPDRWIAGVHRFPDEVDSDRPAPAKHSAPPENPVAEAAPTEPAPNEVAVDQLVAEEPAPAVDEPANEDPAGYDPGEDYWQASGETSEQTESLSMLEPPADLAASALARPAEPKAKPEPANSAPADESALPNEVAPESALAESEPIEEFEERRPERWVMPTPRSAFTIRGINREAERRAQREPDYVARKPGNTAGAKPSADDQGESKEGASVENKRSAKSNPPASERRAYRGPSRY